MSLFQWAYSIFTGVLIKRGSLETHKDAQDAQAQTKGHAGSHQEGCHLQDKKNGLRRNHTCPCLEVALLAYRPF